MKHVGGGKTVWSLINTVWHLSIFRDEYHYSYIKRCTHRQILLLTRIRWYSGGEKRHSYLTVIDAVWKNLQNLQRAKSYADRATRWDIGYVLRSNVTFYVFLLFSTGHGVNCSFIFIHIDNRAFLTTTVYIGTFLLSMSPQHSHYRCSRHVEDLPVLRLTFPWL